MKILVESETVNNAFMNAQTIFTPSPRSKEVSPGVRNRFRSKFSSYLTSEGSHFTWSEKVGQLYCVSPRKFHRPPMMTRIIFPCRVDLAPCFYAILSYILLYSWRNSVAALTMVVCIYFWIFYQKSEIRLMYQNV